MPYNAEISRANPSCFLFLIDQSGSMSDPFGGSSGAGRSKSQELADALNHLLQTLVTRCAKGEEVLNRFEVGVTGYGQFLGSALQGVLAGQDIVPIRDIAFNPLRLENRMKKVSDGAGGLVEQNFQFPVWIDPINNGGTPMCEALRRSKTIIETWLSSHQSSYPPTLIHITDGESTDGDPTEIASQIKNLETTDGPLCMFNLHLSSNQSPSVRFPDSQTNLPDQFAQLLFNISSPLPPPIRGAASTEGFKVNESSRGFVFNAGIVETIQFLDIGTRVSNLR